VLHREVRGRLAQLAHQQQAKLADMTVAKAALASDRPSPELLDQLPRGPIDLPAAPEARLRALFDACRLEIRYDRAANVATFRRRRAL
jgi:hypothetical protein